jgi:hypothetical protein
MVRPIAIRARASRTERKRAGLAPHFRPLPQSVADALVRALASMPRRFQSRRFPVPWSYNEEGESFIVSSADGRPIAYIYFNDGDDMRRDVRKRMTREEAQRIAKAIARLPDLLTAERARGAR